MAKISVSIPDDILDFIDHTDKNRSKAIVTIIRDYKKKKEDEELARAYEEYDQIYAEEMSDWEKTACIDMEKQNNELSKKR